MRAFRRSRSDSTWWSIGKSTGRRTVARWRRARSPASDARSCHEALVDLRGVTANIGTAPAAARGQVTVCPPHRPSAPGLSRRRRRSGQLRKPSGRIRALSSSSILTTRRRQSAPSLASRREDQVTALQQQTFWAEQSGAVVGRYRIRMAIKCGERRERVPELPDPSLSVCRCEHSFSQKDLRFTSHDRSWKTPQRRSSEPGRPHLPIATTQDRSGRQFGGVP